MEVRFFLKTYLVKIMNSENRAVIEQFANSGKRQISIEWLRRAALVVGMTMAASFANWTDFRPYYAVTLPDKSEIQEALHTKVSAPEAANNPDSLIDQSTRTVTPNQIVKVDGAEWQTWFKQVQGGLSKGEVPQSWLFRLTADDQREVSRFASGKTSFNPSINRLIFAEKELPLSQLLSSYKPGKEILIAQGEGTKPGDMLKVYYSAAPSLTGLGSGIYGVPEAFSYPLRHLWYAPLLAALALYCLLPWQRGAANLCMQKRWQVVLGDFASSLLFGMFMALPLFIVGGTIQAVTEWLPFTLVFWSMALLGLWAFQACFFYAVYQIRVLEKEIVFVFPGGVRTLALDDIEFIEPVKVVPPRWLIIATFLSALAGSRTSAISGAAGRGYLLESSSSGGLCLGTRAGESIYIWLTNSSGGLSITNLDILLDWLKRTGARQIENTREFDAIVPPTVERTQNARTTKSLPPGETGVKVLETASRFVKEQTAH